MGEHEGAGGWGYIRGGMGRISELIAESGRRHGMDVKTDASVTRKRFLNTHCDSDTIVLTAHFPTPSVGHIVPRGNSYDFIYKE